MSALAPLVRALVSGSVRAITGYVLPARSGDRFDVQAQSGNSWRTVAHGALGSGGTFVLQPTTAGTYRIVYRGLPGPAVTVR
jgi:hypothetical protein